MNPVQNLSYKNQMKQIEKELKIIKIGHATFTQQLPKLIKKRKTKIIQNTIWTIQYNMYKKQKWSEVFDKMIQSQCIRMDFHFGKQPKILLHLQNPIFPSLVTLQLQNNNIDNIQALFLLQAPNLKFIDLDDNNINCCRGFLKSNWPQFNKIQLRNNPIKRQQIFKMKQNSQMRKIYLDTYSDHKLIFEDVSILFKIQCASLQKLQIQSFYRICQQKIFQMLSKRFQQIYLIIYKDEMQRENILN